jgi:hypothetical protein
MRQAAEVRRLTERLLLEVHDEIGNLAGWSKAREKLDAIAVAYLEALERDYGRDPELVWELLNAYSRFGQSLGGGASNVGDAIGGSRFARRALELGALVESSSLAEDRRERLFGIYENLVSVIR